MKLFGRKAGGEKDGKMNGEKQTDLTDLQREREKHSAALSGVQEKIAAIEEKVRLEREEIDRRERERASLQKKLEGCRLWIRYVEGQIAEYSNRVTGQVEIVCAGTGEALLPLKSSLQELAAWQLELEALKEFEGSIPAKIEKLTAPA